MKRLLLLLTTAFFIQCGNPVEKNAAKQTDSIVKKDTTVVARSEQSAITCPKCGFKKTEIMPTDVCQLKYTCTSCKTELYPKKGDCCVFCTYGTKKCPSMQ